MKRRGSEREWDELRRRLEAASQRMQGDSGRREEERRRVLDERARVLAEPPAREISDDRLEVTVFESGGEVYGVEAVRVRGIFRLIHRSCLPGSSPPVAGLTLWRGALLTLMDLSPKSAPQPAKPEDRALVVVLGDTNRSLGVLADSVRGVDSVQPGDFQPPRDGGPYRAGLLRGVTPDAVLILDADTVLALDI